MNALPDHVIQTIEELVGRQSLKGQYQTLSTKYRFGEDKQLSGMKEHLAYLASRLPATYAVNIEVIRRLQEAAPHFAPSSILDVGAGPATCLLALTASYTTIQEAQLVEKNSDFIELGKKLLSQLPASWKTSVPTNQTFDLVISSYMLNELAKEALPEMLTAMMRCTRSYLVLIDNGTPAGYEVMMQARNKLIENGFFIHAPCPHQKTCPMHWCHFVTRLPRTHLHKQVKEVERGYEDEKFCYLIASREPAKESCSRIVKAPLLRSGHVRLALCTPEGTFAEQVVSKKMKERYKEAKKAEWGELF